MIVKQLEDNESLLELFSKRKSLLVEMEGLLRCEEVHWSQKAKCKWLKEGYENTKLFYKVANGKRRKSFISKLCIEGVVEDFVQIKDEGIRLFVALYSKEERVRPTINNLFSSQLDRDVAKSIEVSLKIEEVKEAIFSMGKDKSPGPDRFLM